MKLCIIVLLCLSVSANPQTKEKRLTWSSEAEKPSETIKIEGKKVTFQKGKTLDIAVDETVSLSDNERLGLFYDWKEKQARIFDVEGKEQGKFKTDKSYGRVQISNAGLIVADAEITHGIMYKGDLSLFDTQGKSIYQISGIWSGRTIARFSSDGKILAALCLKINESQKHQPMAILLDKEGEMINRELSESYDPGGVYFSRDKLAFAVYMCDDKNFRFNDVYILDAKKETWSKISCNDLNGLIGPNSLAMSEDGNALFLVGANMIQAYAVDSLKKRWERRSIDLKNLVQDRVDAGVYLSVVGRNVIAAHRVFVGENTFRYLISFFDDEGNFQDSYVTTEQPNPLPVSRIWDIDKEGNALLLNLEPKKRLELHKKKEKK